MSTFFLVKPKTKTSTSIGIDRIPMSSFALWPHAWGLAVALVFLCGFAVCSLVDEESPETLTRIAFGSCSKADMKQPLWEPISSLQPQVFIWGGDNVYADKRFFLGWWDSFSFFMLMEVSGLRLLLLRTSDDNTI